MSIAAPGHKRMAESSAFPERWGVIEDTIYCVFRKEVSRNSFQRIHQAVFQLCQAHLGGFLLEQLEEQFYAQVSKIIKRLQSSICFVSDFLREWHDYNDSISQINTTLMFFNKSYLYTRHHSSIEDIGERIFCTLTLGDVEVSSHIISSIKKLIHVPAAEETLRDIAQELYAAEDGRYFVPCMETPFLEALVEKYRATGEQKRCAVTPREYLRWVQRTVNDERCKYADTFFNVLVERLSHALYSSLIMSDASYFQKMLTGPAGLTQMLEDWDVANIAIFATVFCELKREKDVIEVIANALKENLEAIIADSNTSVFPFPAVTNMLRLIARAKELDCFFSSEVSYGQSPFLRIIRNTLGGHTRFMEVLCLYYDYGVRQGEDEIARTVGDDVLTILQLTPDLEAFEVAFRSLLAARLIHAKPHAVDSECAFIDRLFRVYGTSMVNRFQKMLEDIRSATVGQEKLVADMETRKTSLPLGFDVLVLTSGLWPQYTNIPLNIPEKMETCRRLFYDYYYRRHNGRKLVFQMSLGSITLELRHENKTYCVSAHTHFVNSILALNSDEVVSVAAVARYSALENEEILSQFNTLCNVGLAERTERGFRFNRSFYSPKPKVKVSSVGQKNAQGCDIVTAPARKMTDGARTMSLDAIIIKLLKDHRSIDHETLCASVQDELRFVCSPTRKDIKFRIDFLIEKGFLTRGEVDNCYVYCS